jgi:pectate lyase
MNENGLTTTASATADATTPGAWPDAANTGVPAGTVLMNYTGPSTVQTSGTLIENKTINGGITVKASNVTIRNCKIQGFGWWGVEGENSPNIRIERCTFVGPGAAGQPNSAILGSGSFAGNDIRGVCIGIQLTDGASTVRDNYIHDLLGGQADPHYDGVTCLGRQNHVVIDHNTFIVPGDHGTASVLIGTNFGPINDVLVSNNLMRGKPSYTVYSATDNPGQISNVRFVDNVMERGAYGYAVIAGNTVVWTNNKDFTTGNLIPSP